MGHLLAFSLQSAICQAVLYLFYKIILSRETHHRFNRIVLLSNILLSLLIPFIASKFIFPEVVASIPKTPFSTTSSILINFTATPQATVQNHLLAGIIFMYTAGCIIHLIIFSGTLFRLLNIIRQSISFPKYKGVRLLIHSNQNMASFSWMNCIIMPQTDWHETDNIIFIHEQAHVNHKHSWDIVCVGLYLIFQWYNPVAWCLFKDLKNIHEYEADEAVLKQGVDAKQYQLLLIKKAVGDRRYSLANSFSHSNLKKRITMMLQKKSSPWARLKYAFVLPLATISIVAFAHPEISDSFNEISSTKVSYFVPKKDAAKTETHSNIEKKTKKEESESIVQKTLNTSVVRAPEKMPEFPGGESELIKYINKHIIYPKKAIEEGVQGLVIVSFTISKYGDLYDINIIKSISPELDAEAMRLIKEMPKWKPGKMKGKAVNTLYTLPITYKISN